MKAPRFNMDAVLNYRRLVEEGIQRDLAGMAEMIKKEESRISYLEGIHNESMLELKKRQERQMSSLEIDVYYTFIAQTAKEIEKWRKILNQIKSQYEKKRAELIAAFKDRRIVETIKEKMESAYRDKLKKEGQKVVDEISMCRYNQGRSPLR